MLERIRLSRARGFRLPTGTVNCARPGPLGNPFVVGRDGTRAECVSLYALMLGGFVCLSSGPSVEEQQKARTTVWANLDELRGKDLACWCALDGSPCHADVLLALANEPHSKGMLDRFVIAPPP